MYWESLLSAHSDGQLVQYLVHSGFKIGCYTNRKLLQSITSNVPVVKLHSAVVGTISIELKCNCLVEILPALMKSSVSEFSVIPKKHQAGKLHLIVWLIISWQSQCLISSILHYNQFFIPQGKTWRHSFLRLVMELCCSNFTWRMYKQLHTNVPVQLHVL